jgi:Leu/Phe-tRNA-protein transferase
VMRECAIVPRQERSTWISPAFLETYGALHDRGLAHSVEAWREGRLVGGLYGVSLGAAFMGESMFSRETDASKVAFVRLMEELTRWGFVLVDCQVYSPHLESLGAMEWPREGFLRLLAEALGLRARPGPWRIGGPSPIVSEGAKE